MHKFLLLTIFIGHYAFAPIPTEKDISLLEDLETSLLEAARKDLHEAFTYSTNLNSSSEEKDVKLKNLIHHFSKMKSHFITSPLGPIDESSTTLAAAVFLIGCQIQHLIGEDSDEELEEQKRRIFAHLTMQKIYDAGLSLLLANPEKISISDDELKKIAEAIEAQHKQISSDKQNKKIANLIEYLKKEFVDDCLENMPEEPTQTTPSFSSEEASD